MTDRLGPYTLLTAAAELAEQLREYLEEQPPGCDNCLFAPHPVHCAACHYYNGPAQ